MIQQHINLRTLNTLALPSQASRYFALEHVSQVSTLLQAIAQHPRYWVLGGGSNVLLAPQLSGLLIHNRLPGLSVLPDSQTHWFIEAGAGLNWHEFVQHCLQQGWYGLENLALIPGTVGAAPVQNIGAYGKEVGQYIHQVKALHVPTGRSLVLSAHECAFGYRDSLFKRQAGQYIITAVVFALPKAWSPTLAYQDLATVGSLHAHSSALDVFHAVVAIRRQKLPDPAQLPNVGSFFKNPVVSPEHYARLKAQDPALVGYAQPHGGYKLAAAYLIDKAGWKGYRDGDVGVHDRQALVLVNYGQANREQVLHLAQRIQHDIQQRYGVMLEQEPLCLG